MKKIVPLIIILSALLCSCTVTSAKTKSIEDHVYQAEIEQEIYRKGQREIVSEIEAAASSHWERYINVDEFIEILQKYYGDEAEEIRDMTIYSGDLEIYTAGDILNEMMGYDFIEP